MKENYHDDLDHPHRSVFDPPRSRVSQFFLFVKFLNSSLPDPRLRLLNESAAEIDIVLERMGYSHADTVIAGIPFKTLAPGLRDLIVQKTYSVLRPKGSFLVYQFSSTVLPYLERVFGHVSRDFELLNIVPARLFYCAR